MDTLRWGTFWVGVNNVLWKHAHRLSTSQYQYRFYNILVVSLPPRGVHCIGVVQTIGWCLVARSAHADEESILVCNIASNYTYTSSEWQSHHHKTMIYWPSYHMHILNQAWLHCSRNMTNFKCNLVQITVIFYPKRFSQAAQRQPHYLLWYLWRNCVQWSRDIVMVSGVFFNERFR